MGCIRVAALCVALVLAFAEQAAAVVALVPHKAIYEITLGTAKSGAGVAAVSGDMAIRMSESCDGWTMEHRSRYHVAFAEGPPVTIESEIRTWESRDGLRYRFRVRSKTGDEEAELVDGAARLEGPGKGGNVILKKPRSATAPLPAGTVFPTDHSQRLMRAAEEAPAVLSMLVFDGLSELQTFLVNAVIGRGGKEGGGARLAPLRGKRWWPAQMAFFPYGSSESVPDQEYGVRFYENGVGDLLDIDFGDFHVKARLVRLEMGTKPVCQKNRLKM